MAGEIISFCALHFPPILPSDFAIEDKQNYSDQAIAKSIQKLS